MENKKKLFSFIRRFDSFGANINFNISGNQNYTSILGGSSYFIYIIVAFSYVLYNFYNFAWRMNLNLIYTSQIVDYPPYIDFDSDIGFAIKFSSSNYMEDDMLNKIISKSFDLRLELREDFKIIKNKTNYEFRYCNKDEINIDYDVTSYLCPDIPKFSNISIYGNELTNTSKYISIKLSLKSELMEDINLLNQIIDLFDSNAIKVDTIYKENAIYYDDYYKPIYETYRINKFYLDIRKYKKHDIEYSKIEFITDNNILISNEISTNTYSIDSIREYSFNYYKNRYDSSILKITIFPTTKIIRYVRTYRKLPEFLADMTGILSQVLIILHLIINYVNEKHMAKSIVNRVMKFKEKLNYSVDNNLGISKIDISTNDKRTLKQTNVDIKPELISKTIEISSCRFLYSMLCLCCKNKNKKLDIINNGSDKINKYLDILRYIRKINEIDLLKFLLFNKEQLLLFNFLSGPTLLFDDHDSRGDYHDFLKDQEIISFEFDKTIHNNLEQSYINITNDENNINRKIMNLYLSEMEYLLNKSK